MVIQTVSLPRVGVAVQLHTPLWQSRQLMADVFALAVSVHFACCAKRECRDGETGKKLLVELLILRRGSCHDILCDV